MVEKIISRAFILLYVYYPSLGIRLVTHTHTHTRARAQWLLEAPLSPFICVNSSRHYHPSPVPLLPFVMCLDNLHGHPFCACTFLLLARSEIRYNRLVLARSLIWCHCLPQPPATSNHLIVPPLSATCREPSFSSYFILFSPVRLDCGDMIVRL